ncbi:MAG: DNA repair ATPase [Deltaproteobacteria bacterium]|nr:DNA repair ATPase [Deltaproteobacteria bacterium]
MTADKSLDAGAVEKTPGPDGAQAAAGGGLDGGSYEVLRARLREGASRLGAKANALNEKRKAAFGGIELQVIGNTRVRTEQSARPRDLAHIDGTLILGHNVHLGLRREVAVRDVFTLFTIEPTDGGVDASLLTEASIPGLFDGPDFKRDFSELYQYYKSARLVQIRRPAGRLLAVFQIGATTNDVKVFRWSVTDDGRVSYIDNRGDDEHVFPPSHDFEWIRTRREDHVVGKHPHVSILDEVFVETVGGDLTVKIENNTHDGLGIYREPVDDPRQSLDDADIQYAKLGELILLKIRPYAEERWRYLVFSVRSQTVERIDAIGLACVQLPEEHGIIFPGGYCLSDGVSKVFDPNPGALEFKRVYPSPNGEDVLYAFYDREAGLYTLLPYNVIRKEVKTPLQCEGFAFLEDGTMILCRTTNPEPSRVHAMQLWRTPFMSDEYAAREPTDGSFLSKVGNRDLVRGISDALSLGRLANSDAPARSTFEDLIKNATRMLDDYYWLSADDVGDLKSEIAELKRNADLIVAEFEKVQALRRVARATLEQTEVEQHNLLREVRPDNWSKLDEFTHALAALKGHRGRLMTKRDVRYIDLERLDQLEGEIVEALDRVGAHCTDLLLDPRSFEPLRTRAEALVDGSARVDRLTDLAPLENEVVESSEGLASLSEIVANLKIDDALKRTQILDDIAEALSHQNRARAAVEGRRQVLRTQESRHEFGAQLKLLAQSIANAVAMADTPARCDLEEARLLVQIEELESRFGDVSEFTPDLADKRQEIVEAVAAKRQTLVDAQNRRIDSIVQAANRILSSVERRAKSFKSEAELNAYFAGDAMVAKVRSLAAELAALGDSLRSDEVVAKLKACGQDAVRQLRDRLELFEDGADVIRLGRHKFNVNVQPFELTMVPREDGMAIHLTGTEFYERVDDEAFLATRSYWSQTLVSESDDVCRGEFLACSIFFEAERSLIAGTSPNLNANANARGAPSLTMASLIEANLEGADGLLPIVREVAATRYDEGYERGIHDHDAARILSRLLTVQAAAGLLRFSPEARGLATLFWAFSPSDKAKAELARRAFSLGRLPKSSALLNAASRLRDDIARAMLCRFEEWGLDAHDDEVRAAARYLFEELKVERPRFVLSDAGATLVESFVRHYDAKGLRTAFESDIHALDDNLAAKLSLAEAWLGAFMDDLPEGALVAGHRWATREAAVALVTDGKLDRERTRADVTLEVRDLLARHARVASGTLSSRLDEFLTRLSAFIGTRVPGFRAYRQARQRMLVEASRRLRVDALKPRVLTSFVRNRLIDEVYLPLIGDNLAKQLGAVGATKRTDLMGLLLLVSPPGYGKTTLMEYVANQLGMVFMKINGPALGVEVESFDPTEAPNATSRQEVEKLNQAFEMATNVMLYVDDIQHTSPVFLQKFISLCDGSRRVEGVWRGETKTYDLRGRKFCVAMAGNPYTESGHRFQVPDMLANRADVYNLGEVLDGREDLFAESYIENALTSNAVLGHVATRSLADVRCFVRMARGEEVPVSTFSRSYSALETQDVVAVLKHLFRVQSVLLSVNKAYIGSASTDDQYRTEPAFKLQGSYRNMNKIAERVAPALDAMELETLIDAHYAREAQTLTSGAEHNLLKLAELRGTISEESAVRWAEIKREFRRRQQLGGKDDDPVTRVSASIGLLGNELEGIRRMISAAAEKPPSSVVVQSASPVGVEDLIAEQARMLNEALIPLAKSSIQNLEAFRALGSPLVELVEILKLQALLKRSADG